MKRLKKLKGKRGNVALETVLGGGVIVMVSILLIGYFTYVYPRYMLDLEVQNLANAVKLDGKLNQDDYEVFIENMMQRGYDREDIVAGTTVKTRGHSTYSDGSSLITTPTYTSPVIDRDDGQIVLLVTVPSNSQFLSVGLKWFGSEVTEGMQSYTVKRVVMSEAYSVKPIVFNWNGGGEIDALFKA